ncbi:MAG: LysM peptidoglycan-binding domain-containing protein [Gammaproteobacteria bacterium]|nr:LysM peptidoglycan-binding domain-containing protein [Gammaproteobacteria bacterium]
MKQKAFYGLALRVIWARLHTNNHQRLYGMMRNILQRFFVISVGALAIALAGIVHSQVELNPASPDRYTVQKGDTLWDIAGQFLTHPWRWPAIWKQNDQIENPHLIYPGDVLVMTYVDGDPQLKLLRRETLGTVKLSPAVYSDPIDDAIPTIPPSAIQAFLTAPLVVDEGELDDAGHVVVGVEDNVALGKYQQLYARGLTDSDHEYYKLFRPGRPFVHPDTQENLGLEAIALGDARIARFGEISKLDIVESREEIGPGDRVLEAERDIGLPHYFPHAPENDVRGYILRSHRGVAEVGAHSVVAISLGEREGIEDGHVLRIMRTGKLRKDPVDGKMYQLPNEESGLLMVFRTFEKVSYGLILNSSRQVHILDVVQTP